MFLKNFQIFFSKNLKIFEKTEISVIFRKKLKNFHGKLSFSENWLLINISEKLFLFKKFSEVAKRNDLKLIEKLLSVWYKTETPFARQRQHQKLETN